MTIKTFHLIFVLALLCGLVSGLVSAQPIIAGVKIGAPLTDAFNIATNSPTFAAVTADAGDFVWGPFVELKLPYKFSIEADALHRGYHFGTLGSFNTKASSWEIPIVAKYHLLGGPIKPYVEGGLSFSHFNDIPQAFSTNHTSNFGIVLGAGVQINLLVLRLSPELRYTGNTLKNFTGIVDSNRNQVEFLVGIGFGGS
jgi:Outer membrane protein beta-barrel domain